MPRVEIAPGLFIGSQMADIRQERKDALKKYLSGNKEAWKEVMQATEKYENALLSKNYQRKISGLTMRDLGVMIHL